MRKNKIGILSLGCPRNIVDSESILGRLFQKGYSIVDINKADIGAVNTCAFIEDAKAESVDAILDLVDLKREGKLKKIIVYGCLPERYKEKLQRELPEIDAFVGKISFPAWLFKDQAGSRPLLDDWRENHDSRNFSITPKHYVYLKICEGCINHCSFCVIPKIKGRFTSLDINSALGRVKTFNKDEVSEINIIGQDITGYGMDLYKDAKLTGLLGRIIKEAVNVGWIRLLYLYPSRISDELLNMIKDEPKICKYIDLPIQHINERILKLMRRKTTKKEIVALIEKIRKKIPDVAIRTAIITGFPSETEQEFKELLEFIKDAKFERLGAFIYSREEDTAAYNFKKQVPAKISEERMSIIMSEQQKISGQVNRKFLGKTLDVLIDEKDSAPASRSRVYLGRSQYDAPEVDGIVYVKSAQCLKAGDFVKVKITDTLEYDLVGETSPFLKGGV